MLKRLLDNPPLAASVFVFLVASTAIIGALVFEHVFRYEPCELCYLQRKPWYFLISFGLLLTFFAAKGEEKMVRWGLLLAGVILVGETALAAWHAGIEWKWWPGPASCSGATSLTGALPDLTRRVVLCDEAPVRFLGLSFAGWNVLVSLTTAIVTFWGAAAPRRQN